MLLNSFVPQYDFHEVHSIVIQASAEKILGAIMQLTPSEIPLVGILMSIRSLPSLVLYGKKFSPNNHKPFAEQILQSGFLLLGEEPKSELLLGLVGQFWKLRGGICREVRDAKEFNEFTRPGWAKVGWNFFIDEHEDGCVVRTETRIVCTDAASMRRFARYWFVIHPGSALIRRTILKAIKRRAEAAALPKN